MAFKRLQEQAYDHLRAMLLSDAFEQGVIYSETRIAETLGISRTPVRDALQRLSHERLIDIMPSKGFRVHRLTYNDVVEIHQMRCAIEGYCVRLLSLESHTPRGGGTLGKLEEFVKVQRGLMERNGQVREFVDLDDSFHDCIISYSNNGVFKEFFANQTYRMRLISHEGLSDPERRRYSLKEHEQLLAAIRANDPDLSHRSVVDHFKNIIEKLAPLHTVIEDR